MTAKFYKGRPVKAMRRIEGGILLTFWRAEAGQRGEQCRISQADWDRYGERREVERTDAAFIRSLVR